MTSKRSKSRRKKCRYPGLEHVPGAGIPPPGKPYRNQKLILYMGDELRTALRLKLARHGHTMSWWIRDQAERYVREPDG